MSEQPDMCNIWMCIFFCRDGSFYLWETNTWTSEPWSSSSGYVTVSEFYTFLKVTHNIIVVAARSHTEAAIVLWNLYVIFLLHLSIHSIYFVGLRTYSLYFIREQLGTQMDVWYSLLSRSPHCWVQFTLCQDLHRWVIFFICSRKNRTQKVEVHFRILYHMLNFWSKQWRTRDNYLC